MGILTGRYCDWSLIAFGAATGATVGGVIGFIRLWRRGGKGRFGLKNLRPFEEAAWELPEMSEELEVLKEPLRVR